jgi:hypothetical protein
MLTHFMLLRQTDTFFQHYLTIKCGVESKTESYEHRMEKISKTSL